MTKTKLARLYVPLSAKLRVEIECFLNYRKINMQESYNKFKGSVTGPFWKKELDQINATLKEWKESKKESICK